MVSRCSGQVLLPGRTRRWGQERKHPVGTRDSHGDLQLPLQSRAWNRGFQVTLGLEQGKAQRTQMAPTSRGTESPQKPSLGTERSLL